MNKLAEGYIRITNEGDYECSLDGKEWESISGEEFDELKDSYIDLTDSTVEDEEEKIHSDLLFGDDIEKGKASLNKVYYVIYATTFPDGSRANPNRRAMFWTGSGGKIMDRRFAPKFSFWRAQAIMDNKLNKDSKYEWKMLEVDDMNENINIEDRLNKAGLVIKESLRTWDSTHIKVILKEGVEKPDLESILNDFEDDTNCVCTCEIEDLPDSYSANIDILDNYKEDYADSLSESIEKHNELNPDLFQDGDLKEDVKEHLLKIVDKFKECLEADGVKLDINDIIVVGSNASYNYTEDSDIDLHIVAKAEESQDLYNIIYNAYKSLFNNKYDIMIKGHEVEVYVELNEPAVRSNGIYSLNTGWLKKPDPTVIPEVDEKAIQDELAVWEQKYNELLADVQNNADDPIIEEYVQEALDINEAARKERRHRYCAAMGLDENADLTEDDMDDYWLDYVATDYACTSSQLRDDLLNNK